MVGRWSVDTCTTFFTVQLGHHSPALTEKPWIEYEYKLFLYFSLSLASQTIIIHPKHLSHHLLPSEYLRCVLFWEQPMETLKINKLFRHVFTYMSPLTNREQGVRVEILAHQHCRAIILYFQTGRLGK